MALRRRMIFCWGCGGWWVEGTIDRCWCDDTYAPDFQDWCTYPPIGFVPPRDMTDYEHEAYVQSILTLPKRWRPTEDVIVRDGLL